MTEETAAGNDPDNSGAPKTASRVRSRRKEIQLWDDVEFRRRVQTIARDRGFHVRDVMNAAGVAADYVYKPADGRNSNIIMRMAEFLKITPAELAGWTAEPSPPPAMSPVIRSELPEALMRSWERQSATMLFTAVAVAKGSDLSELARSIGLRGKHLRSALKDAAQVTGEQDSEASEPRPSEPSEPPTE